MYSLKFYVKNVWCRDQDVGASRWDIGVTVSRRDRDVQKNASRPSRDRDRDYNPDVVNCRGDTNWQMTSAVH